MPREEEKEEEEESGKGEEIPEVAAHTAEHMRESQTLNDP